MKKLSKLLPLILKEILLIITDLVILSVLQLKSICFARCLILKGNIFPLRSNTILCLLKGDEFAENTGAKNKVYT